MKKTLLSSAVKSAIGFSAAALVMPGAVYAQESGDAAQELEEVMVTGSRIQKANLVSSSPVTQIGAEDIQVGGITRVEDLLNDLPQVAASNSSGDANGATGTATLNLRNLGTERTLVLVNGRRLPSGSPKAGAIAADLNQIPAALIKRVEMLTGGASSAYGSDAIAGVANFIMVDDFEGVQVDYQHSFYQHKNDNAFYQGLNRDRGFTPPTGSVTDGHTDDFSLIIGGNFDDGKGNVTAYATYREIDPVRQEARDYSNCALNAALDTCSGSSTLPTGRFTDFATARIGDGNGGFLTPRIGEKDTPDEGKRFHPITGVEIPGFDFITQGDQFADRNGLLYNYAPANFYQRPDERYTAGVFARYEMNDQVEFYTELNFMDDQTNAQIAPSGAFFVTSTLPCGNPLLTDQQFQSVCGNYDLTRDQTQSLFIGRRNVEGGFRNEDLRHTSFRGVFGLRGDINEAWSYDTYYSYSEVSYEGTYNNELSTTRITRALDAVEDSDGNIVCRSVVDGSDPNCVPWNVFRTGGVTQEQIDYLQISLFDRGTTDQKIISGFVAGDLGEYDIKMPAADNGVQVAFGLEYRKENIKYNPDQNYISGDGAGQGGPIPAVSGGFEVKEIYSEVSIPLIEGREFAEELALDLGYRYSDYSTDVDTDTYKVALGWAPSADFKARASYQKAVRHANIRELFRPQAISLYDMSNDPCSAAGIAAANEAGTTPWTVEECARTGLSPALYGVVADSPAGQFNQLAGGNPDLKPESSETVSYGFIWTPEFADGLTVTVDYYNIDVQNAIDNISPQTTLERCRTTGDADVCGLINRGPVSGTLWIGQDNIQAVDVNTGFIETEGVDFTIEYEFDIADMGSISIANIGNYVMKFDRQEFPGATTEACEGFWGGSCGAPTAEVKNNLNITWHTPWDLSLTSKFRHIGEIEAKSSSQADLGERTYWDLGAIWQVTEETTLRAGVSNVLDREPPFTNAGPSIFGNGNTFPGTYDALGRYIFLGASVSF